MDGRSLTPGRIELHGLHWLTDAQVRAFIGAPRADSGALLSGRDVHLFLRRLARSGLFARVEPRVRVAEAPQPAVLEVHLEENPVVSAVEVNGLQDLQATEILEELLWLPHRFPTEDEDEESFTATLRVDSRRGTLSVVRPCPPRYPPRDWVARLERGTLHPGIFLGGVAHGLERTLKRLRDDGYMLASLSAVLSPDGKLMMTVDEGRLESIEVRGVDADIAARVQDALDLKPGTVFLRSDAKRAVRRLTSRLPFLEPADANDSDSPRSQRAHIIETREPDGTRAYHTQEAPRAKPRHREQVEFELNWKQFADWWDDVDSADSITLEGKKLVVHLRTRRPDFDVDLLPMHTQVTGFSPGLSGRLRLWDAKDRAHLTVDAALTIPLRWGGQYLPDDPEGTQRQRRINMLGGAKLQVPRVGLAELGAQVYDFTDTLDRWRMGDIDSSLYSALINRPDRDYFRRKGLTAFATWRWADDWLAGAEYRNDRYESMRSFTPPFSLFRNDSAPFPNAPVTEGRFDSVVVRMEYASNVPAAASVGSLFRTPETSLFDRDGDWESRASLRGLLTLEVGNGPGSAGGDARFWKLVSDIAMEVPTGWDTGLSLRVRTAGATVCPNRSARHWADGRRCAASASRSTAATCPCSPARSTAGAPWASSRTWARCGRMTHGRMHGSAWAPAFTSETTCGWTSRGARMSGPPPRPRPGCSSSGPSRDAWTGHANTWDAGSARRSSPWRACTPPRSMQKSRAPPAPPRWPDGASWSVPKPSTSSRPSWTGWCDWAWRGSWRWS
ncbi:hypothetical protein QEG98_06850 [Myxococcus sp. MxC21-1]|uniref:hypothetical protein n=1 Tax=Myxococcus sp. MxC21-1 TaxID=3041439 RepID=UPI002930A756|nr:hypothetical protein [Myxococcus sp. MxC21-1]WNZ63446.1 hypothetical protein QEG98_06850 [Myxococcus sp. MxC21-1]